MMGVTVIDAYFSSYVMIKSTKAEFHIPLQTQKHDTHEHNDAAADVRRCNLDQWYHRWYI